MKRLTEASCSAVLVVVVAASIFVSCKKKDNFDEPNFILRKWAKATETLNFRDYKNCEAFPKSEQVFREIYRDYYIASTSVTRMGSLDEKNVNKDPDGNSYISRAVSFECTEMKRSGSKPVRYLRGDVEFIKYEDGDRKSDGWLMWNRIIVRINK